MMSAGDRLAVVTPVLNDWACLERLLADLDAACATLPPTTIVIVDDGSTDAWSLESTPALRNIQAVEILRLGCNLGHQRAIAAGLVEVNRRSHFTAVVVMDADGEDRPADLGTLWAAHEETPGSIVVAQRASRTEGARFRAFYAFFKWLFRAVTGRELDFGNFSVVPATALSRIVLMPELWNHYPATLMRSRVPLHRVPIDRGTRYLGNSRMNFTSLVTHGLASMAAFIDTVFARLLVLALILTGALAALAGIAVVSRLITQTPMPGWAALGGSVASLALVQVIASIIVVSFLTLSARSTPSPPPSQTAAVYVRSIERIEPAA